MRAKERRRQKKERKKERKKEKRKTITSEWNWPSNESIR
jgi:hypothetical protein